MKDNYVYLAGPIEDVSESEMKGWRIKATNALDYLDIPVLDPTRRISFHDQLGEFVQDEVRGLNLCKRIFKQDLQDIAMSKVVLADVRRCAGRGTGTSMELMFAHTKNKIIILLADEDDYPHPFIESLYTEKHYDLESAIEAVGSYYG